MFNFKANDPTTVDGVMAAFNATIAQLNQVQAVQTAAAEAQAKIAADAQAAADAAKAEAKRAAVIAGKMSAVFE